MKSSFEITFSNHSFQEKKLNAFKRKFIKNTDKNITSTSQKEQLKSQNSNIRISKLTSHINLRKNFSDDSDVSTLLIPSLSPNKKLKNVNYNGSNFFLKLKKPREIVKRSGDLDKLIEYKHFFDDVVNLVYPSKTQRVESMNVISKNLFMDEQAQIDQQPEEKEIYLEVDNLDKTKKFQYYINTSPGDPIFFPEPCNYYLI